MGSALQAKPGDVLIADKLYQHSPLKNADKNYSLRTLRLCV
jgi:hypothetical protein